MFEWFKKRKEEKVDDEKSFIEAILNNDGPWHPGLWERYYKCYECKNVFKPASVCPQCGFDEERFHSNHSRVVARNEYKDCGYGDLKALRIVELPKKD